MVKLLENISQEDFVIWKPKTKELIEEADIVYHYTTIIEMINNDKQFLLGSDEEIICVASLPIRLQKVVNEAIERTK
jgi:hypothetical protein